MIKLTLHLLRASLSCTAVWAAVACESGGSAGHDNDELVVRDSAGIRIVKNPEHAPDSTSWRIDTVPSLVIGDDESKGEAYLFGSIVDAVRLSDGRLVGSTVELLRSSGEEGYEWLSRAPPPPLPPHVPAFDRYMADELGNLWVRSDPPEGPGPATWFIFDRDGVLRRSVRTDLIPTQIGGDHIVAILPDEHGVSRVALFGLRKE